MKKVRSACSLCQNFCGLLAYVENDKVIKLEGDPENPRNSGHLCAKGLSGFMNAYSPRRVRKPLFRTNPQKGIGVDPGWKEVSWEMAIDKVSARLKDALAHAENELGHKPASRIGGNLKTTSPWSQRIILTTFDHWSLYSGIHTAWVQAVDAFICMLSASCFCGNSVHQPSYLNTSTFELTVDPEYSKYILLIGAQAGSIIHYDTMNVARHIAGNRPGNIKVVSIDPVSGYAGSKAEEWVPIRPGTDTFLILSLINVLVNENGTYDAEFLRRKTNAPYLVSRRDGFYVRDTTTGKPLVWDTKANAPRTFDKSSDASALEGSFEIESVPCAPAFELVKEHLKTYSPERAFEVTTVQAQTIRRLAKEIGDAACIGQTITIDGKELPYRPISVIWYRGLSAHKHAFMSGLAAIMLPTILGAIQVPGAVRGHPPAPESVTTDGLMASKPFYGPPYPPRPASRPKRVDLYELFPVALGTQHVLPVVLNDPGKFGIEPERFVWPEIMFIFRDNVVKNSYSPSEVIQGLSKIPFIVCLNLELDETANAVADVVFPDLHHLEKLGEGLFTRINEPGYWYAAKPAVKPPFDPPWDELVNNGEIFLLLAEKAGFLGDVYGVLNINWQLKGTPYELDTNNKYSYKELVDRRLKVWLGPDKGIDWLLSDQGGLLVWGANLEQRFKGAFREARLHIYYEFMLGAKNNLDEVLGELGLDWWDTSDYQAIPDWKPCPSYLKRGDRFNLFLVNYKIPIMAHGFSRFNPLPMKLVSSRKHLDSLLINPLTAAMLDIHEGDEVAVETSNGFRQVSIAHLTERVHPEVVACSQHKFRRGIDFNEFATLDESTMDFLSAAVDSCILVRVSRT